VLPEPLLVPYSQAVEVDGQRVITHATHFDGGDEFVRLPPDFAARELLAIDPDVEDDVWAWSNAYGGPYSVGNFFHQPVTMAEQAQALRSAQQAAVFVLAELLDGDDVPEPYMTEAYRAEQERFGRPSAGEPGWGPQWEAFAWLKARLASRGPFIATEPEQLDVELNYGAWDDIVAVQLYNYVAQRPTWQRCDNAPWHGNRQPAWFTVQRTDRRKRDGYGPQDAGKRVRFCSRACAKSFTERERRRRLKEDTP
jgi:hypothetical protein